MNKKDYDELSKLGVTEYKIYAGDLDDRSDRVLIYGYDFDRKTFYLVLKDETFYIVLKKYGDKGYIHYASETIEPLLCIPNKRVYPDASDFEFCKLLILKGVDIPFTVYDEERTVDIPGELLNDF